jgi:hypothetical protein
MARDLLAIVKSPENILSMTQEELAYALLEDMQARLANPIYGMANQHHVGTNLFSKGRFTQVRQHRARSRRAHQQGRPERLHSARKWVLAEPADDMNGGSAYRSDCAARRPLQGAIGTAERRPDREQARFHTVCQVNARPDGRDFRAARLELIRMGGTQ